MFYFDQRTQWSSAGFVRHFFWNPLNPEFTSLQLFSWAVIIGVVMGVYTAIWKWLIEFCIEQVWVTVPKLLLKWGFFTDLKGWFPLYHYMWICPAIMGGILSYICVVLPIKIPDQNDWIRNVHTRGVQDHRTFWNLLFLSTAGMASGLSLGPELPLVLTAGMAGSWLGLICKQSILQARVMNLTAASAAVGGFFGFPMAGALFVLGK
jgi:H+/Cl- antiporter ClcA